METISHTSRTVVLRFNETIIYLTSPHTGISTLERNHIVTSPERNDSCDTLNH